MKHTRLFLTALLLVTLTALNTHQLMAWGKITFELLGVPLGANVQTASDGQVLTYDTGTLTWRAETPAVAASLNLEEANVNEVTGATILDFDGTAFNLAPSGTEGVLTLNFGTGAGQPAEGNNNRFNTAPTTNLRVAIDNGSAWTATTAATASQVLACNSAGNALAFETVAGDLTKSGATWTIANDAVTFAKFQNLTDARLVGRSAGSSGDAQEITVGAGLSLAAGSLTATGSGATITVLLNNSQIGGDPTWNTIDFSSQFAVTESPEDEANVSITTDAITAVELAANSVDTSEIVGGAPGATGAELADSVTNITANTTLTLVGAGTGGVSVGAERFEFKNLSGFGGADADYDIPYRLTGIYQRLAKGSNSTVLQTDSAGVVKYGTVTDAMVTANSLTAGSLAPNSVDVSEIVGGAPGAAGGELADSVTNITSNTTLTLVGAGTGGISVGAEPFEFKNLSGAAGSDADYDIPMRLAGAYLRLPKGSNSTVLQTDSAGVVKYATVTDAMHAANSISAGSLAANSVDTSEIVGGAPGAAGGELADSVTNITSNTTLTLVGAGTGGISLGAEPFEFKNLSGFGGTDADGDIPYRLTGIYQRLAKGADSTVLTIDPTSHLPKWSAAGGGGTISVEETDGSPTSSTATKIQFQAGDFTQTGTGATVVVQLATNSVTSSTIAANAVDTSEIVGGACGASGAELADSVTNITAATDLTVTATGDEVIFADQEKLFGTTADPTNEQDYSYDTTDGVMQVAYKVGRVTLPGTFFRITTDSTAITDSTGGDFSNGSFTLPASVIQAGTVIDVVMYGKYSTDATINSFVLLLKKGSTTIFDTTTSSFAAASMTDATWILQCTITGRSTTSVEVTGFLTLAAASGVVDFNYSYRGAAVTINSTSEALKLNGRWTDASGDSMTLTGGYYRIH